MDGWGAVAGQKLLTHSPIHILGLLGAGWGQGVSRILPLSGKRPSTPPTAPSCPAHPAAPSQAKAQRHTAV